MPGLIIHRQRMVERERLGSGRRVVPFQNANAGQGTGFKYHSNVSRKPPQVKLNYPLPAPPFTLHSVCVCVSGRIACMLAQNKQNNHTHTLWLLLQSSSSFSLIDVLQLTHSRLLWRSKHPPLNENTQPFIKLPHRSFRWELILRKTLSLPLHQYTVDRNRSHYI